MLDAKVWKENRKAWFNVVVEGIMKDYESKKILAQVRYHSTTLESRSWYSRDNETPLSDSLSVQNLSVHLHCTDNEVRRMYL